MGFTLQKLWHGRAGSAQVTASGSDNSFTSFPVNQDTKHPTFPQESPVESAASRAVAMLNKENVAPPSFAMDHRREPALSIAPSSSQLSTQYDIIHMDQEKNADLPRSSARFDSSPTEGFNPPKRRLGRTLSKVKSMTDIQFAVQSSRERAPRMSEGNFSRLSYRSVDLGIVQPPLGASHQQNKQGSARLSSFLRRKLSVDSLASLRFQRETKMSPLGSGKQVVSSPISSASPWSLQDDATMGEGETLGQEMMEIRTPAALYPPSRNPISPSTINSFHIVSPCLAGIEEENDNYGPSEGESESVAAAQGIGLGLSFDPLGASRQMEPIFKP